MRAFIGKTQVSHQGAGDAMAPPVMEYRSQYTLSASHPLPLPFVSRESDASDIRKGGLPRKTFWSSCISKGVHSRATLFVGLSHCGGGGERERERKRK
jgi:hypothetical protein